MAEIFLKDDIHKILTNKYVVILGGSVQRSMYKDMVRLLQENRFLTDRELRMKGEPVFANDECLVGRGGMHNGVTCREVRQYCTDFHLLRYYYVTRCYNKYMESVLKELTQEPYPDVIIMNSCIWDITRYGSDGIDQYKENMPKLLDHVAQIIRKDCVFIWLSTLPVSETATGGFVVPDMELQHDRLRVDIIAANQFNRKLIEKYGYDFLDIHYFLRNHIHRRAEDGIHWDMTAHRRMTNTILTHICLAWGVRPPGNAHASYDQATEKIDAEINALTSADVSEAMSQQPQRIIKTAKRRHQSSNALNNNPSGWMSNQENIWPNFFNMQQWPNANVNTTSSMLAPGNFAANNAYMSFNAPQPLFSTPILQCPRPHHRVSNTAQFLGQLIMQANVYNNCNFRR